MISIKDVLLAIRDRVKPVGCGVFLQERPSAVDKSMEEFIVCDVGRFSNKEISWDGSFGWYTAICHYSIFVRDRTSAANPNSVNIIRLSELIQEVMRLFPFSDDKNGFRFVHPRLSVSPTNDDGGFHYAMITFNFTSY